MCRANVELEASLFFVVLKFSSSNAKKKKNSNFAKIFDGGVSLYLSPSLRKCKIVFVSFLLLPPAQDHLNI